MSYMYCGKCGYKKLIPIVKYRFIGICISAFGVFGWFSFLFAGSGHAFLIACSIFLFGIYFFYNAEDLAKSSLRDKPCPKCNGTIYEDSDPFDKKDQYADVEVFKLKNSANGDENIEMPKPLFLNQENTNYKKEKIYPSAQHDELDGFFPYKAVMSSAKKIPSSEALFYVGETIIVYGNVSEVIHFENRTLINLGKPYPREELSILIWNNNLPSFTQVFGDLSNLEGNQVYCIGTIEVYRQHIQMKIRNPAMLRVMQRIDNFNDVPF